MPAVDDTHKARSGPREPGNPSAVPCNETERAAAGGPGRRCFPPARSDALADVWAGHLRAAEFAAACQRARPLHAALPPGVDVAARRVSVQDLGALLSERPGVSSPSE